MKDCKLSDCSPEATGRHQRLPLTGVFIGSSTIGVPLVRINDRILEAERHAAPLKVKELPKYFAFEEQRSKQSSLSHLFVAVVTFLVAATIGPTYRQGAFAWLLITGLIMLLCLLVTVHSRRFIFSALARIVFVNCCAAGFCILSNDSPNALFWGAAVCAVMLVAMSFLYYDPLSHLISASAVFVQTLWPHHRQFLVHAERPWFFCLIISAFLYGVLINHRFFMIRTRVYRVNRRLAELAYKDALTGISNRRAFFEDMDHLRASEMLSDLCLLMIDADDFKAVNDLYGHEVGDDVLRDLANVIQQTPGVVLCGRLGGEEFAVIARCDIPRGVQLAKSINRRVTEAQPGGICMTVSIGVAYWLSGTNCGDITRQADQALYEAKRLGKNCCYVFCN